VDLDVLHIEFVKLLFTEQSFFYNEIMLQDCSIFTSELQGLVLDNEII
jgi:hypothetical protein